MLPASNIKGRNIGYLGTDVSTAHADLQRVAKSCRTAVVNMCHCNVLGKHIANRAFDIPSSNMYLWLRLRSCRCPEACL